MKEVKEIAVRLFGTNKRCSCGGGHEICLGCGVCRAKNPDQLWNEREPIANYIDSTLLKADAREEDIKALCSYAIKAKCKAVCINSHYLPYAKSRLKERSGLCTVINFPLGSGTNLAVLAEAEAVLDEDIDELDMVQNLPALLSGYWMVTSEAIREVKALCNECGTLLKVILETCFLTREELIISCLISKQAGADFVKTSTGMGPAGATAENVRLMRTVVGPKMGVKASGGIRTREDALLMLKAGANRIGTSNAKAIIEG
ncbi:MAG: deoxyribose-phosphate aldolase [Candidatus Cloacimonadaceae bacterium]